MNENKFEYNGIKLKAEEMQKSNMSCDKCYFLNMDCELLCDKKIIPNCMEFARKDKRDVIFIEVQNGI